VQVTDPRLVAGPHAPATSTPPRSPGSASCTHLNDTLRSLADLGALLRDTASVLR
jgi:hypothetical protein